MSAFTDYRKQIEEELHAGNATEYTHRPALKALVEAIAHDLGMTVTATNEPKRVKCGAPDYIITKGQTPLGYIEAKDVDKPLNPIEKDEQMARYLDGLDNLILTDYLEFRWYVGGEKRMTARLASVGRNNKLRLEPDGEARLTELISSFLHEAVPTVGTPKELAVRMAALAHLLRESLIAAFADEQDTGLLHSQLASFREVLLPYLQPADFMDIYAQTICYGLFTARCNPAVTGKFDRWSSVRYLPKTNPFLKKLFGQIAGPELDDEPFVWVVDDLADLLNRADIAAILENFGKRTRQQDPVVHFYETFLAAYDPKLREMRGVYYTPEPVVSYIVRSVDLLLKTEFGLPDGLADTSMLTRRDAGGTSREIHKVQILDPATGTGTFLHGVIDQIQQHLVEMGQAGMWNSYVSTHLLPRLFGFELLMAPYAVAHMKLGLQLSELGYDFQADERLRIYLTNTLQEAFAIPPASGFSQWLNTEAIEANKVKQDFPILIVLGNPPYSGHSANKGTWISDLLHGKDTMTGKTTVDYFKVDGKPLGEKNPKYLNDDYVKFIRFAQWRIEQTGYGILAYITNHGYLDNPTFRGMRQSLINSFDVIYILDLHGNSKKREIAPHGEKDENVFDIQQGVSIGIFVKRLNYSDHGSNKRIFHAELWGTREAKYQYLLEKDVASTEWEAIIPETPLYLLKQIHNNLSGEYALGWAINDLFKVTSSCANTARDAIVIDCSRQTLYNRIKSIADATSANEIAQQLGISNTPWWNFTSAFDHLKNTPNWEKQIIKCIYRPFDYRWVFFDPVFIDRPRLDANAHMMSSNLSLVSTRQTKEPFAVLATNLICGQHKLAAVYDRSYFSPLYLYPENKPRLNLLDIEERSPAHNGRRPNLAPEFIVDFSRKLKMTFIPDGNGDWPASFGPEDVFDYIYAVFHAPTYRARYAEFLRTDFPRVPLTSNSDLFRDLCLLGNELVNLHLLENVPSLITRFPVAGSNTMEGVRYSEPHGTDPGRVWINKTQYIDGVPPRYGTTMSAATRSASDG